MANVTGYRVKHPTTTANVVDVVTFGQSYRAVEIINRSTTTPIYATVDRGSNNQVTLTPTVAGDDCYYIGPGAVRTLADDDSGPNTPVSVVRLISAAAVDYTVTGLNPWVN